MPHLEVDNRNLDQSRTMLAGLDKARQADTIDDEAMKPFQGAVTAEFGRMRECQDNLTMADQQIAELQKALAGWSAYREWQARRYPGLERRYKLARDYVRAAEDEQTSTWKGPEVDET